MYQCIFDVIGELFIIESLGLAGLFRTWNCDMDDIDNVVDSSRASQATLIKSGRRRSQPFPWLSSPYIVYRNRHHDS